MLNSDGFAAAADSLEALFELPAHEFIRHKRLETLTRPNVSVEERIEAAQALKAEFSFGTLLRTIFEEATT